MFIIKFRTSVSLPVRIIEKLAEVATDEFPVEELAILCLKRFLRRKKITGISNAPTCTYNRDKNYEIRNIWLSRSEHHNVKMYRVITGESVSFLMAQAVDACLDTISAVLRRISEDDWNPYASEWFRMQLRLLNSIDRILRFSSVDGKGVLGLRIVMHRPKLRWAKSFRRKPKFPPMPPDLRERFGL